MLMQTANAQVSQEWVRSYNGVNNLEDQALASAIDASGNFYVTGYSTGSATSKDYRTIKYNSSGVQQWTTGVAPVLPLQNENRYKLNGLPTSN